MTVLWVKPGALIVTVVNPDTLLIVVDGLGRCEAEEVIVKLPLVED